MCYWSVRTFDQKFISNFMVDFVVMGRTPFYWTSNELKHHFSNIEQTRTRLSIGNRTRTPFFWLWRNKHLTLNLVGLSPDSLNYSSNRLGHHFSNIEPTRMYSSIGNRTGTPFFWLRTFPLPCPVFCYFKRSTNPFLFFTKIFNCWQSKE